MMAPQESYKQYFGENLQSGVLTFTFSNFSIVRIESNFVMNQTKIFKLNKPLGNISSRQIRLYTTNSFSDGYAELSNLWLPGFSTYWRLLADEVCLLRLRRQGRRSRNSFIIDNLKNSILKLA